MPRKPLPKQTPPLPPNQAYVDANKQKLKAIEAKLASQKLAKTGKGGPKY